MLTIIYYDVTYYGMSVWKQKYAAINICILLFNNKLMNEAGYLMKNYGDRGGCLAEADSTLQDLHDSSYDTNAELNSCFIIHSK